jgi:hypothetical protein
MFQHTTPSCVALQAVLWSRRRPSRRGSRRTTPGTHDSQKKAIKGVLIRTAHKSQRPRLASTSHSHRSRWPRQESRSSRYDYQTPADQEHAAHKVELSLGSYSGWKEVGTAMMKPSSEAKVRRLLFKVTSYALKSVIISGGNNFFRWRSRSGYLAPSATHPTGLRARTFCTSSQRHVPWWMHTDAQ